MMSEGATASRIFGARAYQSGVPRERNPLKQPAHRDAWWVGWDLAWATDENRKVAGDGGVGMERSRASGVG